MKTGEILVQEIGRSEISCASSLTLRTKREFPTMFIIEDPARITKIKGVTRIPRLIYESYKRYDGRFYTSYKSRFGHQFVWQLANVPNFTGIIPHIGNTAKDTRGCPLTNFGIKYDHINDQWLGIQSTEAYKAFL